MFRSLQPYKYVVDGVLAVLYLLLSFSFMVTGTLGSQIAVAVLYAAALGMRRWSPGLALWIAWIASLFQVFSDIYPGLHNVAVLGVLYTTSAYGTKRVRSAGLISVGAGALVAAAYLVIHGSGEGVSTTLFGWTDLPGALLQFGLLFVGMVVLLATPWLIGLVTQAILHNREVTQAQRAAEETVVIEQERNRIARDMHDVVAHSLAVVIAQADGARYARQVDPESVDIALTAISSTAREALADVRVLLGQLRHSQGEAPQPGLADLERLLEQLRAAGLTVAFAEHGDPAPLSTAHQLAVYRIVQEALTNALRHGDATRPVALSLTWQVDTLEVMVHNAKRVGGHGDPGKLGHGLAGMRERAVLVGGKFSSSATDHDFTVHAEIPFSAAQVTV
ncbi:sensor histidine kinase [Diaminobutyricimonas sp. TR449]|uniref:sensor histidine kinase n=1 Tax=Diaminobutyricimonas sp. TR449 TaxID=2708076 RepID=UPI0014228D84|nr:sensor histidine kinase [Diaminobutyricimonas sp. TR449]